MSYRFVDGPLRGQELSGEQLNHVAKYYPVNGIQSHRAFVRFLYKEKCEEVFKSPFDFPLPMYELYYFSDEDGELRVSSDAEYQKATADTYAPPSAEHQAHLDWLESKAEKLIEEFRASEPEPSSTIGIIYVCLTGDGSEMRSPPDWIDEPCVMRGFTAADAREEYMNQTAGNIRSTIMVVRPGYSYVPGIEGILVEVTGFELEVKHP